MIPSKSLKEQSQHLTTIISQLNESVATEDKLELLKTQPLVVRFLKSAHPLAANFLKLDSEEQIAVASIAAIGQADNVFRLPHNAAVQAEKLQRLLKQLVLFEDFYQEIGGIIGYHNKVLELIFQMHDEVDLTGQKKIYQAQGTSLAEPTEESQQAVLDGIRSLPMMGEIYPIGGAGDRLDLHDEESGLPLPTAKLNYLGDSLLTNMIKDLQAREFLYYKLFDKQLTTPIAMMTSEAKNNHFFIEQIIEQNQSYHRPADSFKLFVQPLAPVITVDGQWSLSEPLTLFLKPSGHGVIWKLAKQEGVFDWFESHRRPKALLRQMNNPMAGTDNGIMALLGIGCTQNKALGFASCQRLVNAAEGVNVLTEQRIADRYHYAITNIEYTEFKKYKLQDSEQSPGSPYSVFPSNTNILFIDLEQVKSALSYGSIPGMLINMKSKVPVLQQDGSTQMVQGGRLESTMQNIADYLTDDFDQPQTVEKELNLRTFLTYNKREKTISVAKKTYKNDGHIQETPEGCYFTRQYNNYSLLTSHCNVNMPIFPSLEDYTCIGPQEHILLHPSLGPLYQIIAQKIQKGMIHSKSELVLELSELKLFNFELDGSLRIKAVQPMGHLNEENLLQYSNLGGKCQLINVKVTNAGIDRTQDNVFWQNKLTRSESFNITLEENAEFYAQDVHFEGDYDIHVPKNTKMVATMDGQNKVLFTQEKITEPTWYWHYQVGDQSSIQLIEKR